MTAVLFAFPGWYLMPASLTLGWLLNGRTAEGEGHGGAWGWHKAGGETTAMLPLLGWAAMLAPVLRGAQDMISLPAQARWWAGLGRLHAFSLSC